MQPMTLLLVGVGFLGMEAVTYLVHRFVMHGFLHHLHVSHHRSAANQYASKAVERNDAFPALFSLVVMAAFWTGFNVDGWSWLVSLFIGVSLYGLTYTLVHDGIIHGRIRWMKRIDTQWSRSLGDSHRAHHRTNGEPYGMLFPSVTLPSESRPSESGPSESRPSESRRSESPSKGSRPSQVPVDQ